MILVLYPLDVNSLHKFFNVLSLLPGPHHLSSTLRSLTQAVEDFRSTLIFVLIPARVVLIMFETFVEQA